MAVVDMLKIEQHRPDTAKGALYHTEIIVLEGTESDTYLLPITEIYSIAVRLDGDGVIEFSNDSPETITTGSPTFIEWDGASIINLGLTAFRVKRTSGTVTAIIAVKTASV